MKINREYRKITDNILYNENYQLLKKDNHHGTNKYDHCKRVSVLSFLLAKLFRGNKKEVARAGLLHDFFFGTRGAKEENSYLKHPFTSSNNAKKYFNASEKELDIIKSHMYHHALFKSLNPFINDEDFNYLKENKPKNKESIIVCIADLLVSIYEVGIYKIRYNSCLYIIFLLNFIRL